MLRMVVEFVLAELPCFTKFQGGAHFGEYFEQYFDIFNIKYLFLWKTKYTIGIARISCILSTLESILTTASGNEKCDFLQKLLVNLKSGQRFVITHLMRNFHVIGN
jgi:hypothetical protein